MPTMTPSGSIGSLTHTRTLVTSRDTEASPGGRDGPFIEGEQETAGSGKEPEPAVWTSKKLDGLADRVQDAGDLATQEDKGDDRHDGDEGKDQRVLGETLAFLISTEGSDK